MESAFLKWLLDQIATIVFMALVVWGLWKEYKNEKRLRAESDKQVIDMAENVVKVTLLYDEHMKLSTEGYKENKETYEEILRIVKRINDKIK